MVKLSRLSIGLLLFISLILMGGYLFFYIFSYQDCIWTGQGQAWVDKNENGVWDAGELALANVRFRVDDVQNGHTDVGDEAITGNTGETTVTVWLPGCPRTAFEVYAEPPPDYSLTTAPRLSPQNDTPFAFGFVTNNESN